MRTLRSLSVIAFTLVAALGAQAERLPTVRVVSAPRLPLPGLVDSNSPFVRDLVEGEMRLFAMVSWGGTVRLSMGSSLYDLPPAAVVEFTPEALAGIWMESLIVADDGTWFGYYHQERPAEICGRMDRYIPRLGAARSVDQGRTWQSLGIILEMPADSNVCASSNRYVLGGVGDVSAMLDKDSQYLYFFFTQYVSDPGSQGIGVGRLAWADRDEPAGKISVWQRGAWIPARQRSEGSEEVSWEYPIGSPLVTPTRPWHDGNPAADAYWGSTLHWNTYLQQYVMLINRASDETFGMDGIYVAFSKTLADPADWSAPRKILNHGGWYAQVVGLEHDGTDKVAGRRARLFYDGRSEYFIDFER
jgi:hypothetical protein